MKAFYEVNGETLNKDQNIDQEHCVFCKLTVRQLKEENRRIIIKITLGDMIVEGHCSRCVNSLIKNYYPNVTPV